MGLKQAHGRVRTGMAKMLTLPCLVMVDGLLHLKIDAQFYLFICILKHISSKIESSYLIYLITIMNRDFVDSVKRLRIVRKDEDHIPLIIQ